MSPKLIVIIGPTAVGKTNFAVRLASLYNGEIISADSRQVYKGMTIGTGKDLDEYKINNIHVPYHLIDITEPSDEYNLYQFQKDFKSSFNEIINKNKLPFLVGGTGLYIHSVLKNYSLKDVDFNSDRSKYLSQLSEQELINLLNDLHPTQHNTTDSIDRQRTIKAILIAEAQSKPQIQELDINPLVIGIREERKIIKDRITLRLKSRLKNGMIEEVEGLIEKGITFEKLNYFGLEYRYIGSYIKGEINYNDMYQKLNSAIHKFAKRQMTWFRKMEREGVKINWLAFEDFEKAKLLANNFIK